MKAKNECPFCRKYVIDIVKSLPPAMKGLQVECDNCGARGPIYETEQDALLGWNFGILGVNGRQRRL